MAIAEDGRHVSASSAAATVWAIGNFYGSGKGEKNSAKDVDSLDGS